MSQCFMLRKCIDDLCDSDKGDDINVQVNLACCGGIVKKSSIDQIDDNHGTAEEQATTDGDEEGKQEAEAEEITIIRRRGKSVESDLLRSKQSRSTKFSRCFSCCCKCVGKKDKTMVDETIDIHAASSSA